MLFPLGALLFALIGVATADQIWTRCMCVFGGNSGGDPKSDQCATWLSCSGGNWYDYHIERINGINDYCWAGSGDNIHGNKIYDTCVANQKDVLNADSCCKSYDGSQESDGCRYHQNAHGQTGTHNKTLGHERSLQKRVVPGNVASTPISCLSQQGTHVLLGQGMYLTLTLVNNGIKLVCDQTRGNVGYAVNVYLQGPYPTPVKFPLNNVIPGFTTLIPIGLAYALNVALQGDG